MSLQETSAKLQDSDDKAMVYQKRIADLESANVVCHTKCMAASMDIVLCDSEKIKCLIGYLVCFV